MFQMQRAMIPLLVFIASHIPTLTHGAPPNHPNMYPHGVSGPIGGGSGSGAGGALYDDRTGLMYDQSFLATQVNRQLSTVPRLEYIKGNHSPGAGAGVEAEERKDKGMGGGLPHSPLSLGPWITYTQTYYNPFIYGGPNGPPTFVPSLGVWPSYNQADGY